MNSDILLYIGFWGMFFMILILWVKPVWAVVLSAIMTVAMFKVPLLFWGSVIVWLIIRQLQVEQASRVIHPSKLIFRYDMLHHLHYPNQRNAPPAGGFTIHDGASWADWRPKDGDIPDEMFAAAQEAVNIDPYNHYNDAIVTDVEVQYKDGKPVITDWVVTDKQIISRYKTGYWDKPKGEERVSPRDIVGNIPDDMARDADGNVIFPAPDPLAEMFRQQFNGPRRYPRVRK